MKIWDSATGKELFSLKGHAVVEGVAFSPDGQRLASGSQDQTVKIWDSATGKELFSLKGHAGLVWSVAFSPDGQRLASGSDDPVTDLGQRHRQGAALPQGPPVGPSVAFSPDGQRLASGATMADGEDLGQRDRQGAVRPQGPCRFGHERGVQPGRPAPGVGEL